MRRISGVRSSYYSADEALDRARMASMGPSLIDIVIADLDLTDDDDGIAAIEKMRRSVGYNVPAVLLMTPASIEIGKPALGADVSPLRKPVNVDELNALIGEVLKLPRIAADVPNFEEHNDTRDFMSPPLV